MSSHASRKTRRHITLALGAAIAVAGGAGVIATTAGASAPAEGTVIGAGSEHAVKGSYIVQLKGGGTVSATGLGKDLAEEYGGKVKRTYSAALKGFATSGLSAEDARKLAADDKVAKVFQNQRFTINGTQKNPPNWGLDRIDQKKPQGDGSYTYPASAGKGVTVYVIDTGVRIGHKDFGGRASYGFDAVDGDKKADDPQGHGTHVAGTVAGSSYGVAKKSKIVAVRVLDENGSGTTDKVVAGIDWVTKNHKGPSVANMSLGGGVDQVMDAAVKKSIASGVTYSVAAGNESQDASQSSPARIPEAITVAASDKTDKQAEFSNFGKNVDVYAPGVDIVSASNKSDSGDATMSGTSMAAPHVAGAAALYLAGHTSATPQQVASGLTKAATPGAISNPSAGTPNKLLRVTK
ncbi:S8 family serine peptidase [Streptomyces sp. NPDC048172]|uniref:S8 family peptidase n=1 Tax=Streptomyces sp. NPDC048172 TaxID=3365505 RepID=UPI00371F7B9A